MLRKRSKETMLLIFGMCDKMENKKMKPYVLDDRCIISEEVKNMTREERDREIKRLEEEGRKERDRIKQEKRKVV